MRVDMPLEDELPPETGSSLQTPQPEQVFLSQGASGRVSAPAERRERPRRHPGYLNVLVFVAGLVTLGLELSAARLLDPWFGNSIVVWAALIGLVLACLSLGYWAGGRLADRHPVPALLYAIALVAALMVALLPLVARAILQLASSQAMALNSLDPANVNLALLGGSALGVFALFAAPTFLLGMVSPFAVRLALADVSTGGQVAGRLYALSTAGSLLGTFLPVLVLIPAVGTRMTFVLLGSLLALTSLVGLYLERGRASAIPALLVLPFLAALAWVSSQGAIKPEPGLIHEGESLYNYYQVVQRGPETWLKLNEGIGLHSVYHPQSALSEGIWDYFLAAPLFARADQGATPAGCATVNEEKPTPGACVDSLYLVGLAGGTVAQLYTRVYGPIPVDGAELDPAIVAAARSYFGLDDFPNVNAVAADGRSFLAQRPPERVYSVVALDAYRPPYIPFHLATVEFFELVRSHLREDGVVAVNAARSAEDYRLVEALASTMAQVFPSVYVIDESTQDLALGNSLVVATMQPTSLADFQANVAALDPATHPLLAEVARRAAQTARPADTDGPVLTDDRAPIEQIIHSIMLRYLLG